MKIEIKPFSELSLEELYDCLKLRSDVFVVEQDCVYLDLDGLDQQAIHVIGYEKKQVVAYARILAPGVVYAEPAIGRLVTSKQVRGTGFGKLVFQAALDACQQKHPTLNTRIMAQVYLVHFYKTFDFQVDSEEFLEDGIPHVEMVL